MILLDEDVPRQAVEILRQVLRGHQIEHVHLIKWSGKKDNYLYRDAAKSGYHAIVTNDGAQMADPDECGEVKKSGMHRISYKQRHPGLKGLAVAVGSLVAAMPDVIAELGNADGQRLVTVTGINPTKKRYEIIDPQRDPPTYWPR
ncbi:hypothetical protein [Salinispora arenicola]|uniref:hypothetical protein n=1 Tax=Salinispora arenicola TaxID=168697 RepID=UPI0027DD8D86|nr:hypothetical protein [Salinispora arenicola]